MEQKPSAKGARASDVQLGGELQNSIPDALQSQPLHAVDLFADWMTDAERPLRIRIYRARDRMAAGANRSKHSRARSILWLGSQIAGDWAFWKANIEDLQDVIAMLARLYMVAQAIERLEACDVE